MKILDKIKDLFMDEVDVDDEIEVEEEVEEEKEPEKVKTRENVLPKVMRETIKEEEEKIKETFPEKPASRIKPEDFITEMNLPTRHEEKRIEEPPKKFTFPIDMSDVAPKMNEREVVTTNVNVLDFERENTRKSVELYPKKELPSEKPKFKATPVISPVYGILDKNYKKEEVKERDDEANLMKRPSKKVDFETVRKKAFGNLADEIKDNLLCENCELYKEVKKISALTEEDLLYDMTVDDENKDVTIAKAYDNYKEFGVAYEPKVERKQKVNIETVTEKKITVESEEKPKEVKKEVKADELKLDDIINSTIKIEKAVINDTNDEDDEVKVLEKPDVLYEDKVDNALDVEEEKLPTRTREKKETKVDDDFFELIDSMYKERTDD